MGRRPPRLVWGGVLRRTDLGSRSPDAWPLLQPRRANSASEVLPAPFRNGTNLADDRYHLALSLLDALTDHAPVPPPTPYSPHLAANRSTALDRLQARLDGTITGAVLTRVRTVARAVASTRGALNLLVGRGGGGRRRPPVPAGTGAIDAETTVRYLVERLRYAIEQLGGIRSASRPGRPGAPSGREGDPDRRAGEPAGGGWKAKLEAATLKGDVVLTSDEVRDAWEEVLAVAESAADAGSADALLLLGDLYLVRLPVPPLAIFLASARLTRPTWSGPIGAPRAERPVSNRTRGARSSITRTRPSCTARATRSTSSATCTAVTTAAPWADSKETDNRAA